MMVILGIILLILAISVPAFTAMVGSRSIESAQNVVAASLVRARGEAIRRGVPCGVFFYVDPETRRTGVAIVTLDPLTDPDPYDEYKSFYSGGSGPSRDYQGGTFDPLPDVNGEPAMRADRAVVLGADYHPYYANSARYANFAGRPIILTMQHTADDNNFAVDGIQNPGLESANGGDTTSEPPPNNVTGIRSDWGEVYNSGYPSPPDSNTQAGGVRNINWALQPVGTLELIDGIEPELLPASAAAQIILAETLDSDTGFDGAVDADETPNLPNRFRERYASSGVILFDSQGRLVQEPYRMNAGSRLGSVSGLTIPVNPPNLASGFGMRSALGLVIYSVDAFDSAASDGTSLDWRGGAIATANDPQPIEQYQTTIGDFTFLYPEFERPQDLSTPTNGDARFDEYAEERWLDANTIPLMVNRYSGTLVEAE